MEFYPIGVLSRKSGVSVKAIRYYSDIGLLAPAQTTASGYRLYGDREMARLQQIAVLRFLGASIQEVRELLDDEKSLLDFLETRAGAVDAEIERLGRLRKVITQARDGLAQRDDPWRYLKNLERMIGMTEEERDQWWERWLRKILGDWSLPAELIDDFMVDYRDILKRKPDNENEEMKLILALENGEQDRLMREVYEKLGRARGMDADQAKAKMLEHAKELGLAMKADPGDPAIQDYVDNYVSFLVGPGTEADLKRVFDGFCEPFHQRMFTVADSIKGGDRGEKIYQMIRANLRLRLERVSAGA